MELIIISGRSGAGKSVALRALEDIGYYCIDNLPLEFIPQLLNQLPQQKQATAISLDIRNLPPTQTELECVLQQLPNTCQTKIIFLNCDSNNLIRRYSDTRRLHPLSGQGLPLETAIELEQEKLAPLLQYANNIIDTSSLSTHQLTEKLRQLLLGSSDKALQIVVKSFGFKYGIPKDADYVFDARFLPNPHWELELRSFTGQDPEIIQFLQQHKVVDDFIYSTRTYIENWLPFLEQNNRSYLTIAIGCTGGKHRSVYVAEQLGKYFQTKGKNVKIQHNSLTKMNILDT
ncbi:RNase adaptor protein RapZ [Mergibacter septicus]|uniref:RNase adaptor protein RapZ n=1 Tax=Mergibacter septicus TaxID=221402 RepID=A0A8E3MFC7_9PAST|nr:RNase adapter RapZ [Mergibacter septicus]AWX14921.1 RNase adaptor protein RapZ [Mergibacter septicus]QDJ12362.1 RNase adaptor protein RapZ [Mergibacter septicus]QDJ14173.1 RNase adaptor protein RapZ [Mergibacter septicus]UTU48379.1 RNase adapter RapZ [Mergibacter septicus]WMR95994.1 RNase adapter RapZ [Mergibacter septicus]